MGGRGVCRAEYDRDWRLATSEWFFLEGSVPALPKNFWAFNNCTLHFAPCTQIWLTGRFALPTAE